MKKIAIITGFSLSFVFGGVAAAAGMSYYSDLLEAQKPEIMKEVSQDVKNHIKESDKRVHNESIGMVQAERDQIIETSNVYIENKLSQYEVDRMNSNQAELDQTAADIQKEVKEAIDEMIKKELGE